MTEQIRNNFGLTERDMHTIHDIFKKYSDVQQVNIFGSRAKGNYRLGSDIDLVIMNGSVSDNIVYRIISDFEESTLPYKLDLINFPKLTQPELIDHINRVGILFYTNRNKNDGHN